MTPWNERPTIVPASYVILERNGKLLFMRRANTSYMNGYYTMPAGHFDGGEGSKMVAVREAKEEVGVTIAPEDLELVHCIVYRATEGNHDRVSFFFKASKFSGEPQNMEPDKCDELLWADPARLPGKIVWEAAQALEQIALGNIYSEANF